VHELRTRKMGDFALVDAHILVDPLISVSEGHYIAESARSRVLTDSRVLDALIHVDPENDALARPPVNLPPRERVVAEVEAALAEHGERAAGVTIHYLSTGLDVDVTLSSSAPDAHESDAQRLAHLDLAGLKDRLGARRVSVGRAIDPGAGTEASTRPTPERHDLV
jgi:hypothetical protein